MSKQNDINPDRTDNAAVTNEARSRPDPRFGSPSTADEIGEAAGGISGVLVGAGIGSTAGPIGTLIGGMAGAIGGWWAGRAVSEAAERLSESDEEYFRSHYEAATDRPADGRFSDVRGAYYLGFIASQNPNFVAREFDDVESDLERGWAVRGEQYGPWAAARPYARAAFLRGRERRARETLSQQIEPRRPDDRRE